MFKGFQGEGPSMGRPALFIRFLGCNLCCSICDTKFSWKSSELESTYYEDEQLYDMVSECDRIIFTGGEPFLPANITKMLDLTDDFSYRKEYEIETNGTIRPSYGLLDVLNDRRVQLNVSPKFNVPQEKDVDTDPILVDYIMKSDFEYLKQNMIVKILFESYYDIEEAQKFIQRHDINRDQLWMQPCGTSSEQLKKTIKQCEHVLLDNNINLSFRTHVFIYENLKGK